MKKNLLSYFICFLVFFLLLEFFPVLEVQAINWIKAPNAGWSARKEHAATVFNGKIWVIGGIGDTFLKDVWYSSNGQVWNKVSDLANERAGHSLIEFNGEMWLVGGKVVQTDAEILKYNLSRDTWSYSLETPWIGLAAHSSVVFSGEIWTIGGVSTQNQVWHSSDGWSWSEGPSLPSGRFLSAAVVFNNKIWLMGGTSDGSTALDDIWTFDGTNWKKESIKLPTARFGHAAVVGANKIWIIGGTSDGKNVLDDVWSFDGTNWNKEDSLPIGRWAFASVVFNNKIWVMGGRGASDVLNDVWYASLIPCGNGILDAGEQCDIGPDEMPGTVDDIDDACKWRCQADCTCAAVPVNPCKTGPTYYTCKDIGINCATCPEELQGGLVPCGRMCDDPCTVECECAPCTLCHLFVLAKRVIDFLVEYVLFPLAVLMIVIGGVMFLTAAGDPGRIGTAKKILTSVVIGLVIIFLAWLIVDTIIMFITNSGSPFQNWKTINCPIP
jgi:N-acetylneuraminic acid mutarotase